MHYGAGRDQNDVNVRAKRRFNTEEPTGPNFIEQRNQLLCDFARPVPNPEGSGPFHLAHQVQHMSDVGPGSWSHASAVARAQLLSVLGEPRFDRGPPSVDFRRG
jgi:hypothetical protein